MIPAPRDVRVDEHLDEIRAVALELTATLPAWFDRAELLNEGYRVLLVAGERYRPRTHGKLRTFDSYARGRLRAAMSALIRRRLAARGIVWVEGGRTLTFAERNRLVEDHIGLAKGIALELAAGLPAWIDLDDLMQEGYLGLIEAANRYQPGGLVTFGAYARQRVHGRMVDSLRRRHVADGVVWHHPAPAPLSEAADVPGPDGLEAAIARREAAAEVRAALDRLPEKARRLLKLHYEFERPLGEAAAAVGLTEARAAALHREALARLKTRRLAGVA